MQMQFDKLFEKVMNEGYSDRGAGDEGHRGGYYKVETIFFDKSDRNKVWNLATQQGLKGKFKLADNHISFKIGNGLASAFCQTLQEAGVKHEGPVHQ